MPILRNRLRPSRRERARRIDRGFEVFTRIILVAYFFFVLASWVSQRDAIRISQVVVSGTLAVESAMVEDTARMLLGRPLLWKIDRNNFALYPKREITEAIRHLDSRVNTVELNVIERTQLSVTVEEYAPALLWCPPEQVSATTTINRGCYFADQEGHIFSRAPEYSGNPFLIFATSYPKIDEGVFLEDFSILPRDEFTTVNTFLLRLSALGMVPRIVREVGTNDFLVATGEEWTIRFTSTGDPEMSASNLVLLLESLRQEEKGTEGIETIDLRFGNKVFYR